jgi:hypothetical protein
LRANERAVKSTLAQAEVAQLVEQLIRNQQVVGSTPIFGSIPSPDSMQNDNQKVR